MSFTPSSSSIDLFFSRWSAVIPPFQRAYSWEQQHVDKLLDDISEAFAQKDKNKEYFVGTVIVIPTDKDDKKMMVVDGQQRLTTLLLTLGALAYTAGGPSNRKEAFQDLFFDGSEETESAKFANEANPEVGAFFTAFCANPAAMLAKLNALELDKWLPQHTGLSLVSKWITNNLVVAEDPKFFKYIQKSIEFIVIKADSYDDAVNLFERINNDGKPLATGDLLKNFFIKEAADRSNDGIKYICKTWDEIEKHKKKKPHAAKPVIGGKDGIDGFIQKACACLVFPASEGVVPKSRIFTVIKRYTGRTLGPTEAAAEVRLSAETFLTAIKRFADGQASLLIKDKPKYQDGHTGVALSRLMAFPKTPEWIGKTLLALPLEKEGLTVKGRELLSRYLELVAMLARLGRTSKDMNKHVQPYCVQLRDADDALIRAVGEAMLRDASLVKMDKSEARRCLTELTVNNRQKTNTDTARHLLLMLDNWLALKFDPTATPDNKGLSVEHVIAQSTGDCPEVSKLGNLCLLKTRPNSTAQDAPYVSKKRVYDSSNSFTAKLLSLGVVGAAAKTQAELSTTDISCLWQRANPGDFCVSDVAARTDAIVQWFLNQWAALEAPPAVAGAPDILGEVPIPPSAIS